MNEDRIGTGNKELDKVLNKFFEFVSSAKLAAAVKALEDKNTSFDALLEIVPISVVGLLLNLLDDKAYEALREGCDPEGRGELQRARELAQKDLGALESHPAVVDRVKKRSVPERETAIKLKKVHGLTIAKYWKQDKEGKLEPIVRIGFRDIHNRSLLDSTFNWNDLTFLAGSLIEVFREEIERSETVANADLLNIPDEMKPRIAERLRKLESDLSLIRDLDQSLGLLGLEERAGEDAGKNGTEEAG